MNPATVMEWRKCPRFPEWEVSECGDMRRASAGNLRPVGFRMKGFIDCDGYLRYSFKSGNGKARVSAHVLVAEAFIGPRPSAAHGVAHNNGSRLMNHFSNLRWATNHANLADREVHGTAPVGERNPKAKITEADVHIIRRDYRRAKNTKDMTLVYQLEQKYGLHRATIINIAMGKSWSHVPMNLEDAA